MNTKLLLCVTLIFLLHLLLFTLCDEKKKTQVLIKKSLHAEINRTAMYSMIDSPSADFHSFLKEAQVFIDKSLLVITVHEGQDDECYSVVIITCPSGWGKTNNLNMFAFYSELFVDENGDELPREKSPAYQYFIKGLITDKSGRVLDEVNELPLIHDYSKNKDHLAAYPVIRLNGSVLDMESGIESFRTLINMAYKLHEPLRNRLIRDSDRGPLVQREHAKINLELFDLFYDENKIKDLPGERFKGGIFSLCEILKQTYNRTVVIIFDEYDRYVHSAFLTGSKFQSTPVETKNFMEFFGTFMLVTFRDNNYLEKAMITGVLHIDDGTNTYPNPWYSYRSNVFGVSNLYPFYGVFEWEFEHLSRLRGFNTSKDGHVSRIQNEGFRALRNLDSPMFSTYSVAKYVNSVNGELIVSHQLEFAKKIISELLQHETFEDELIDFIKCTDNTPFLGIPHPRIFYFMTVAECELINDLRFVREPYHRVGHRAVVFFYLLNVGIASLHKKQSKIMWDVVIKGPNLEVVDFLKKRILAKYQLLNNSMILNTSAVLEYARRADDNDTLPKVMKSIAEYLHIVTEGKGFDSVGTFESPRNFRKYKLLRYFFLNALSRMSPKMGLCRNDPFTTFAYVDIFILADDMALIIDYKCDECDSIDEAFNPIISYGFRCHSHYSKYKHLKFLALQVYDSLTIEAKGITFETAMIKQEFLDWIGQNEIIAETITDEYEKMTIASSQISKKLMNDRKPAVCRYENDTLLYPAYPKSENEMI